MVKRTKALSIGVAIVLAVGVASVVFRDEVESANGIKGSPFGERHVGTEQTKNAVPSENGGDALVSSDENLDESWVIANSKSPHPETMTQAYELMIRSPPDGWSKNMQMALVAFIGNQPEVRRRTIEGKVLANVVCRSRGCMIELKEAENDGENSFDGIYKIHSSFTNQVWMLQLTPLYQSVMSSRGSAQYLNLFQKVDAVSRNDSP